MAHHIQKRPKIQIICQVKKNMAEHMEFVDLPITQFVLQRTKRGYLMNYTHNADYAENHRAI